MRILVTRPEAEAERTAEALRARGCEPVLSPVSVITPKPAQLPEGRFAAVLLSSQNAVRHGVALVPPEILALPAFAVGQRTAEVARQAGWRNVRPGPGDAAGLAGEIAALLPAGARLLYLAGTPRKPVLESALVGQGYEVVVLEVYQASAASRLPEAACRQLALGQIDAVLHYSREGAQRFLRLAAAAGVAEQALAVRQLCLSGEVAGVFAGGACVLIANHPNEEFLLKLLDDCPSGP